MLVSKCNIGQRELRVSKEVECSMCHGSGTGPNNQKQQCPQCKGKGMIYVRLTGDNNQ